MRERAALVGGNLQIESAPGEGTTILVRIENASEARQIVDHV
jgi:signal transduction histidine kinase